MDLYTIGFTHKTAEQFFGLLQQAGIKTLMDIRISNSSQLAGFTKSQDLRFFLKKLCKAAYVHEPLLAPTRELMESYRSKEISPAEFRSGYLRLLAQRHAVDKVDRKLLTGPTVLLCAEVHAEECHRSFAAAYLAKRWPDLHPVHL